MSATVLYMSMSLDGFIAGPNAGPGNGLGDGGDRLHEWVPMDAEAHPRAISGDVTGANRQVVDEFMATGAVVAGRGTFEPAGGWGGDHHDGVPISVVPVLLGQGRRLFDHMGPEHVELERKRVLEGDGGVTHMHYRVRR